MALLDNARALVAIAAGTTSCGAGDSGTIKVGIALPITGTNAATTRDHINAP